MNKSLVAKIRRKQGLTQEQLADKCNLSVRTIQRLEVGKDTSIKTLNIVANAFNVPISDLFEQIDEKEKREDIMNITNEQIQQSRNRENVQSLFKRLTIFTFIILMLVLGNFIEQQNGFSQTLETVVWGLSWIIGFTVIKFVRNIWLEPYLDRKYPLTKGMDVMKLKK